MASKRAAQFLVQRAPQACATRAPSRFLQCATKAPLARSIASHATRAQTSVLHQQQRRWNSNSFPSTSRSKPYTFDDVLTLVETPEPTTLLIDVREPAEFAANTIPTAINIPVSSAPDALLLPDDDFQDRFGFAKPDKENMVVFFCKAGVRSSAAAQLAKMAGYEKVGEYKGSWIDWERNGGPAVKGEV